MVMGQFKPLLIGIDVLISILLMLSILLQNPKATGLGGIIGGGADFGGGYRTRRGLERRLFYSTWILMALFFFASLTTFALIKSG